MNDSIELFVKFIICTLAVWRLSSLFARESGPFNMFSKIRIFVFSLLCDLGTKQLEKNNAVRAVLIKIVQTVNDGLSCMWCNSVWFSSIISIAISKDIVWWAINTLALSAFTIMLEENYGNSKGKDTSKP